MENRDFQEILSYDFLLTEEAEQVFAKLDYALRNSKHIQDCPEQARMFDFLRKNYDTLFRYYRQLFEVYLSHEGEDKQEYYFIDFFKDRNGNYSRGNIPQENREYLNDAYAIIALLLVRIYVIEPRAEFRITVSDFKELLLREYEEYKPHLLRLFSRSDEGFETDFELKPIEDSVDKALKKFDELAWVKLDREEQFFEIRPSIHRILSLYGKYIIDIDQLDYSNQENL